MSMNELLDNLDKPEMLEQTYRNAPEEFEVQLKDAIEKNSDSETLKVWNARLSYCAPASQQKISISLLITLCFIAGVVTKLPSLFPIDSSWYYPRFTPLIVVAVIIAYFIKTNQSSLKIQKIVSTGIVASVVYLVILPSNTDSASITMALIHLPLLSLTLLAISFMSDDWREVESRLNFIRYLGEMGIYSVLILLGGMVLTGLTFGLFNVTGLSIEEWYMDYIVVLGLVSSPLVATYLYDSIQNRQGKFAAVLSNVFSPLFLITVLAYLLATVYQGKSPFTDREFLITFNGLLIIILALTIFSISGKKRDAAISASDYINISLVSATLIVNFVALTAIIFRWTEYGMTVNRIVVTGVNILIFVHLIMLLRQYVSYLKCGEGVEKLELTIAKYLPVYTLWSIIVSVFLPLVFQFN